MGQGPRPRSGRTRETIASVPQGEDFERLKIEIESDTFDDARRVLKVHVVNAAKAWPRAIEKAADKGEPQAGEGPADAHRRH